MANYLHLLKICTQLTCHTSPQPVRSVGSTMKHQSDYKMCLILSYQSFVLQEWADAADIRLNFHPQGSHIPNPEINIYHTRYDAKGKPFRRYGILAYAALPTNGDMFFDDTEFWAEYHSKHPQRKSSFFYMPTKIKKIDMEYQARLVHISSTSLGK